MPFKRKSIKILHDRSIVAQDTKHLGQAFALILGRFLSALGIQRHSTFGLGLAFFVQTGLNGWSTGILTTHRRGDFNDVFYYRPVFSPCAFYRSWQ